MDNQKAERTVESIIAELEEVKSHLAEVKMDTPMQSLALNDIDASKGRLKEYLSFAQNN